MFSKESQNNRPQLFMNAFIKKNVGSKLEQECKEAT